jgi:hypothetical protein
MQFLEGKKQLCSGKLNVSYDNIVAGSNSVYTLQNIEDAMNAGIQKAWDYKIWPFTEAITSFSGGAPGPNPFTLEIEGEDFLGQSAFLAIVNGVPWVGEGAGKRNFRDYMTWLANNPTDTSKIWAEFAGELYFNANAISGNSYDIDVYGKAHAPVYSAAGNDAAELPFSLESNSDEATDSSGNAAIILFAYAHLLSSEKKKNPSQAALEEKKAYAILDVVWLPIAEGRAQNNPQNQPFFNSVDYFPTRRSTRFDTQIGNFP